MAVEAGVYPLCDETDQDAGLRLRIQGLEHRPEVLQRADTILDPAQAQIVPQAFEQRRGLPVGGHDRSMERWSGHVKRLYGVSTRHERPRHEASSRDAYMPPALEIRGSPGWSSFLRRARR